MSRETVYLALCPCCDFDVAHTMPVADGWAVICDPELNGCGATGGAAKTQAGAICLWNGHYAAPIDAVLTRAALSRAGCLV